MKKIALVVVMLLLVSGLAWAQEEAEPIDGETATVSEPLAPEPEPGTTAAPAEPAPPPEKPAKAKKVQPVKEKPTKERPAGESMVAPYNDRVVIKLNYWTATYNGDLKIADVDVLGGTATIKGQWLDLDEDLGLENPQNIPEVEIQIRMGEKNRITLSYFTSNYGGEERLSGDVDFAGYTFQANTKLETIFQIDRFRFMYEFLFLSGERGSFGISWGAEYYMWSIGYKGTELSSGESIDEKFSQPIFIPLFGISGTLNIGYGFGLYASYNGIGINLPDPKFAASYTDLDCGLFWRYKYLYTGVGYRRLSSSFDAEIEEDEEISMQIFHEGVYWSIGASF